MTVYAAFKSAVEVVEITDSWDTIIANIDNGTYSTKYKLGNYKPLDLGTEGTINMQIVAMDVDELASGGTAPLTFIGMELLNTKHRMNATQDTTGGYAVSEMKDYLDTTIYPLIQFNVASRLQRVNKTSYTTLPQPSGDIVSVEKLWIPSAEEIGANSFEHSGIRYTNIYSNNRSKVKTINGVAQKWFVRTTRSAINYCIVNSNGSFNQAGNYANAGLGVCLGFCLGLEPETISDS